MIGLPNKQTSDAPLRWIAHCLPLAKKWKLIKSGDLEGHCKFQLRDIRECKSTTTHWDTGVTIGELYSYKTRI